MIKTIPQDDIGEFWVVKRPTKNSTISEIKFVTTVSEFGYMMMGGMHVDDIILITKNAEEATKKADYLLKVQKHVDRVMAMATQEVEDIMNGKDPSW